MEGIKNIAIIYGGSSAEREVSIESGEGIFNGLSKMGIKSTLIEYADFEQIFLDNFDLVFIALHGHEGESGELQKVLSDRNIKYTGSSLKGCSQTWNKRICKEILLENHIGTPKWISVSNLETDLKSTSAEEFYKKITLTKKNYKKTVLSFTPQNHINLTKFTFKMHIIYSYV